MKHIIENTGEERSIELFNSPKTGKFISSTLAVLKCLNLIAFGFVANQPVFYVLALSNMQEALKTFIKEKVQPFWNKVSSKQSGLDSDDVSSYFTLSNTLSLQLTPDM